MGKAVFSEGTSDGHAGVDGSPDVAQSEAGAVVRARGSHDQKSVGGGLTFFYLCICVDAGLDAVDLGGGSERGNGTVDGDRSSPFHFSPHGIGASQIIYVGSILGMNNHILGHSQCHSFVSFPRLSAECKSAAVQALTVAPHPPWPPFASL